MQNTYSKQAPNTLLSGLAEYLLIVSPAKDVFDDVTAEKQNFSNRYQHSLASKSKPHITVANFVADERMEDTFSRYMSRAVKEQKGFKVQLNNYSGFPPHKIFARVQDHQPFKKLAASLSPVKNYVESYGLPPVFISKHPHVTIAQKLDDDVYNKAMMDYSRRTYSGNFEVSELLLLKRKGLYDSYAKACVFGLS